LDDLAIVSATVVLGVGFGGSDSSAATQLEAKKLD
jgi:hypothetical protein